MNPFSAFGDGSRRHRMNDRSRYSSQNVGQSRYYGEPERYGRSRTVDGRLNAERSNDERYARSQSRDERRNGDRHGYSHYRSSGSVDRFHQSRSRVASLQYGDIYGDGYGRRYGEDRYFRPDSGYGKFRDAEFSRDGRYGHGRNLSRTDIDRYGGFDRYGYFKRHDYERPGYGYDHYDRHQGSRYPSDRYGYSSLYGLDRSHFETRNVNDRPEQPTARVRFDSERQSKTELRRDSLSDAEDIPLRKDSGNIEDERQRDKSMDSRQAGEEEFSGDESSPMEKSERSRPDTPMSRASGRSSTRAERRSLEREDCMAEVVEERRVSGFDERRPSGKEERRISTRDDRRPSERESMRRSASRDDRRPSEREEMRRASSRDERRPSERDDLRRSSSRAERFSAEREEMRRSSSRDDRRPSEKDTRRLSSREDRRPSEREERRISVKSDRRPSEREERRSLGIDDRRPSEKEDRRSIERDDRRPSERGERRVSEKEDRRVSGRRVSSRDDRRPSEKEERKASTRDELMVSDPEERRSIEREVRRASEKEERMSAEREDRRPSGKDEERLSVDEAPSSPEVDGRRSVEREDRRSSEKEDQIPSEEEERRSSEHEERRPSEKQDRRSSERQDRRSSERQDRRSSERQDRRSSERQDRRSVERQDQIFPEKEERKSSEREIRKVSMKDDVRRPEMEDRRSSEKEDRRSVGIDDRRSSERQEKIIDDEEEFHDERFEERRTSEKTERRVSEKSERKASLRENEDVMEERRSSERITMTPSKEEIVDSEMDKRQVEKESQVFEMQGGNQYRGGNVTSYQFGRDRMPPPIPPFAEPRSHYPLHKVWNESGNKSGAHELTMRATYDLMRRRHYERACDASQNPSWLQRGGEGHDAQSIPSEVIRVNSVDFLAKENSKDHRTSEYELVQNYHQALPVMRRGQTFFMNVIFAERDFDPSHDNLYLNFYFGSNPSVPKRTRVVLPVTTETDFKKVPYQWDARVTKDIGNMLTIEVNVPVSTQVGMWRCVVETSSKDVQSSRLQYRCSEEIYVLFNPFEKEDAVYMDNEDQRYEYVMNDSGKVYTGGYRNVRGRPWVFGQFDDCVLTTACVLLEMSGLPHAERGNPVKVTRALASMIRAPRAGIRTNSLWQYAGAGLIEPKYEENYCGGNSPHIWTGSVQIMEEFLKQGTASVKYAQCWVMAAVLTSLCRALGLPARPVTAFVSALETQDSLTVDRYIDHYGDILEKGPGRDQPDSVWSFHSWCEVYMHRYDQPQNYSGWQATDPCRTYKDYRDRACGPCPVEALRRGDIGQRDDVDAFYASLNSYVRYFYEDDESGWGYSPFRQFRHPVCRYVLTKTVGRFDEEGDEDCEDLTNTYIDTERTDAEKFVIFNSCRGLAKDTPSFEYQAAAFNWIEFNPNDYDDKNFDVSFVLDGPDRILVGQAATIPLVITNTSTESRTIQANICTRSTYYTGNLGPYLKRSSTQLTLEPDQQETVTLTLDPWDYEDKLVDMSFIKIIVTGFVQETGQSFVDEFDFRFSKPWLKIEASDMKIGQECEATFSFVNPLDIPLTDCFITMEVSGCVRPRTIRIDREVRPRESFKYSHTFVPRSVGEHRLVASFASRQLADIIGQKSVVIQA